MSGTMPKASAGSVPSENLKLKQSFVKFSWRVHTGLSPPTHTDKIASQTFNFIFFHQKKGNTPRATLAVYLNQASIVVNKSLNMPHILSSILKLRISSSEVSGSVFSPKPKSQRTLRYAFAIT